MNPPKRCGWCGRRYSYGLGRYFGEPGHLTQKGETTGICEDCLERHFPEHRPSNTGLVPPAPKRETKTMTTTLTPDEIALAQEVDDMLEEHLQEYCPPVPTAEERLSRYRQLCEEVKRMIDESEIQLDRTVRIFAPGYEYPAEEIRAGNHVPRTPRFLVKP